MDPRFPPLFIARVLRASAIRRGKNSVHNSRYGPRTWLIKGIYCTNIHTFLHKNIHMDEDTYVHRGYFTERCVILLVIIYMADIVRKLSLVSLRVRNLRYGTKFSRSGSFTCGLQVVCFKRCLSLSERPSDAMKDCKFPRYKALSPEENVQAMAMF